MKRLIFAFALVASTLVTVGQNRISDYRTYLSRPVVIDSLHTEYNTVRVKEADGVSGVVARGEAASRSSLRGYRVVVFMNNSPSARSEALATKDMVDSLYRGERCYVIYENPYFKVAVGNCTSHEEAIILMERMRRTFPKAFLMRENISAKEL